MSSEMLETVETSADDFFDTPALEIVATPQEIHRAVIGAVTLNRIANRNDWPVIEIGLTSRDVPTVEDRISVFIPLAFDDAAVALGKKFDPKSLPEDETGDYWGKQKTMYTRGINNSEGTASLQKYVFNPDSVARHVGKDPIQEGLVKPTNLDEYVANLAKMLSGVECLMIRRERGGDDPAFKHQLQAKDIISQDEFEKNPKKYKQYDPATKKGYVFKWES